MAGEMEFMFFILFISSFIIAALFGILLFLLTFTTPAWAYFRAKIKHQPLLEGRRRDRKIDLHRAESYKEGLAVSKKYKSGYIIDPDSVYTETKSGVPILPVNVEVGITLNEKILRMIDGLKRMGYTNIEEAFNANLLYGVCSCGYEGMMNFKSDDDDKPVLKDGMLELICPFVKNMEVTEDAKKEESGEPAAGDAIHAVAAPQGDAHGHADKGPNGDV